MATTNQRERRPSLIARAAEILNPVKRERAGSKLSTVPEKGPFLDGLNEKRRLEEGLSLEDGDQKNTCSEKGKGRDDNEDRKRCARIIPPYVEKLVEGDYDEDINSSSSLLGSNVPLNLPSISKTPNRNFMPLPSNRDIPGRRFDHQRSNEAVVIRKAVSEYSSRWYDYTQASACSLPIGEECRLADEEEMNAEYPDIYKPWNVNGEPEPLAEEGFWLFSADRRRSKGEHLHLILMQNPFVPLLIRTIVLLFVAAALALGGWIYHESDDLNFSPALRAGTSAPVSNNNDYICQQQTSTYMAFIVDSCAVLYLMYITYDEYTSEPLGRRSGRAKMRLLYLDLLFIAFSSANLSLAFNTLTDQQWSCYESPLGTSNNNNNAAAATTTCIYSASLCRRQKALCGVLLCALFAWLMTFAISVMRIVVKISG